MVISNNGGEYKDGLILICVIFQTLTNAALILHFVNLNILLILNDFQKRNVAACDGVRTNNPKFAGNLLMHAAGHKKCAPTQVILKVQCEAAFQALKRMLCSAPILVSPDLTNHLSCILTHQSVWGWGHIESARQACS